MEQIYTIPVNETFEACMNDKSLGCPFCRLRKKLEENELELILGASMMEPDVRQKTNRQGFCPDHWQKMNLRGKKLPLALILQSHMAEIDAMLKKPGILPAVSGNESAKSLSNMSGDCYICRRIDANTQRMTETAALLWDSDESFRDKLCASPLCLPHFSSFMLTAHSVLKARSFKELYKAVYAVESEYIDGIREKLDSFVQMFDHRYSGENRNGAETAVADAFAALNGTAD